LNTTTLVSVSSSVTFNNIPQNYRDLILVVVGAVTSTQGNNFLYFNNDTTQSNYLRVRMLGNGSSPSSELLSNAGVSDMTVGAINQAIVQIMDYSTTDKQKTRLSRSDQPSSTVIAYASRWANTAAVTSLTFAGGNGGDLASGSTLTLYGIEA
jgi:hypothetical protein